jgi:hypothetical protein
MNLLRASGSTQVHVSIALARENATSSEHGFTRKKVIDRRKASIAPDFETKNTEGRRLRLSDYKGNKNVLLVFNRGFG